MFFKKRKIFKLSRYYNTPIYIFNLDIILKNNTLYFSNLSSNNYIFKLSKKFLIKKDNSFLYLFYFGYNYSIVGTTWTLIKNIILGFNKFYVKKLIFVGTGYKVIIFFNFLYLYIGLSHPVIIIIPKYFSIGFHSNCLSTLIIAGINKQNVNHLASFIKYFRKPNIYKGKGIKYYDENLILKNIKKK